MTLDVSVVDWKDVAKWKVTLGPRGNKQALVQPYFAQPKLLSFGWPVYYDPKITFRDGPGEFWVSAKRLDDFADYVLQSTGVTLPAFPARAEWIDSSCYKLIQLSHADQFKEIKKEVAHDRHIAETAKVLKEARTAFQVPRRYLALDFETYELDHRFVTEFGISRLDTGAEGIIETRHLITQEYEAFRNGQYVPDCKHRFRHGSSRLLPLEACKAMLVESLQWADALIFHDTAADMDIIQGQLGLRLPRRGVPCYDTKVLFGAKEKSKKGESLGLGRMLQKLGVVAINMHNAGNDAHGTMEAFVSMMQPDLPRIECGTALVLQFESDDDLEF